MLWLYAYLFAGFFFWLGAATVKFESFDGASWASIVRGFFGGVLAWAIIIGVVAYAMYMDRKGIRV